jgi:hypothetical protein
MNITDGQDNIDNRGRLMNCVTRGETETRLSGVGRIGMLISSRNPSTRILKRGRVPVPARDATEREK